jgi:hypothetical protein
MPKLYDEYTNIQKSVIDRLAEIEASDRNMCEGCGGEDCQCCEIYLDRQKWVSPDELFADDNEWEFEPHEIEEDDEYEI